MAHKIFGNSKCLLIELALHKDSVHMASFQISHGHTGQGRLSVRGGESWRRHGAFSLNLMHCLLEPLCWNIFHKRRKLYLILHEKPPSRAHKQDCPTVQEEIYVLFMGRCLNPSFASGQLPTVSSGIMPDVHALALFQWVNHRIIE